MNKEDVEIAYPPGVDVISGLGPDTECEKACQKMIITGYKWLKNQPETSTIYCELISALEIIKNQSEVFQKLISVMSEAIENEATGAMIEASLRHLLYSFKHGWEKYLEEVMERESGN